MLAQLIPRYTIHPLFFIQPQRNKGLNVILPKWRSLRKRKVIVPILPDFSEINRISKLPSWEYRKIMKEEGRSPPRSFEDKPMDISSSGQIFDSYVQSKKLTDIFSKEISTNVKELTKRTGLYYLSLFKLKKFEGINLENFAKKAQEIYIEAHEALCRNDEDKLHELVTQKAMADMQGGLKYKTLVWSLRSVVEPPRVVNVVVKPSILEKNEYGQITVRIHTTQSVSIFDRYGRLTYGDRNLAKEMLQFVVFEKHISGHYPLWRMHGKIVPDWIINNTETTSKTQKSPPNLNLSK